jgi:hypothetical protein
MMWGRIARVMVDCGFLTCLAACAVSAQDSSGGNGSPLLREFQSTLRSTGINASATSVDVDLGGVDGWTAKEILSVDENRYKELLSRYVSLGQCTDIVDAPIRYTNFQPRSKAVDVGKNALRLREGNCISLRSTDGSVSALAGTFEFQDGLSIQVPRAEQRERLSEVMTRFTLGSYRHLRSDISQTDGMLIGESLGYIYHDVRGPIPGTTLFEKKDLQRYRIVLLGEQTLVVLDVDAPLSMPAEKVQRSALPIIRALRYK